MDGDEGMLPAGRLAGWGGVNQPTGAPGSSAAAGLAFGIPVC